MDLPNWLLWIILIFNLDGAQNTCVSSVYPHTNGALFPEWVDGSRLATGLPDCRIKTTVAVESWNAMCGLG